ncbi:MAG: response regulator transcription factor [Halanaerobiales bacterium]
MRHKVLIIDDDKHIRKILKDYFKFENFKVVQASTGKEGLELVEQEKPDIIILDIMMPEYDGWEVCQRLRTDDNIPIIMLSAKIKETDRITGLKLGADDYVTKPFSPKEVVLRAKNLLKRVQEKEKSNILEFPHLVVNKTHRLAQVDEEEINLTPKEFDLLWAMASSSKKVFTRDKLLKKIWGYNYLGDIRTVDTHIKSLRSKLGSPVEQYIKTVWGVGYKFEVEDD